MDKDLLAAAELLKKNGVNVELPQENDDVEALKDEVAQLKAQLSGQQADKIEMPNVIVKDAKGKKAGMDFLADNLGIETNTPMHTTRTGYGAETLPAATLSDEVFEAVPQYETFLSQLRGVGYHGNDMELSQDVRIKGMPGFFELGSEKTADSVFAQIKGSHALPTDKVTITQKQLVARVDITDFLLRFNKDKAEGFQSDLVSRLARDYARTREAAIINGDTETGASGNVNLVDAAPAATSYYLGFTGLRRTAVNTTSPDATKVLSTLDIADFRDLENLLGNYYADPEACFWLMNRPTYNKAAGLQQFYDASVRGEPTTVSGKKIQQFDGTPLYVTRDMSLADATGRVSNAPGNNVKGSILLAYAPAIQWGEKGQLNFKLYDYGAQGVQIEVWGYFGFVIVNQKAGVTADTTVALGIDITV